MCNRFPKCVHAGPVLDKLPGLDRHCETIKPNHQCPYLPLGCQGCTFVPANKTLEQFRPRLVEMSFALETVIVNQDAFLAIVADAWKTYELLQRLVKAGLVTEDWASKSLHNVIQYSYRQQICRLLGAYINTKE